MFQFQFNKKHFDMKADTINLTWTIRFGLFQMNKNTYDKHRTRDVRGHRSSVARPEKQHDII